MTRHLIIFTRAPRLGAVKRRLAGEIGEIAALRFHRAMLSQLLHRLAGEGRWRIWIALTPNICVRNDALWPHRVTLLAQGDGDLGQRMARSFRALPPGPAVLVGSDIPGITNAHIARAFAALGRNDLVFGPASDGGYWLIGARRRPLVRGLFANVRWSGPQALADTVKNAGARKIGLVDMLSDVDTAADYALWRRLCSCSRGMISTRLHGRKR